MTKYIVYLIFFAITFYSCNDKPKWVLSEKKMQAVVADIMKVEAYTKNFLAKDSQKNSLEENAKMQLQVFALHNVTKDDFYKSYEYYMEKPKLMGQIFDSIINKANNERFNKTSLIKDSLGKQKFVEQ